MNDACASAGDKNLINVNWTEMSGGGFAGAGWFAQPLEVEKISLSRLTPLEKHRTHSSLKANELWQLKLEAEAFDEMYDSWQRPMHVLLEIYTNSCQMMLPAS